METLPYTRSASYYDDIYLQWYDYELECKFLENLFRRHLRRRPAHILDLGCGTGNHALQLAKRGYRVTGVDVSPQQIAVARKKLRGFPVDLYVQDMRRLSLRRRFPVAVCMFGGFRYILKAKEALRTLRGVRRHLTPGGLFVFEFWHVPGVHADARRETGYKGWDLVEGERTVIRLSRSHFHAGSNTVRIEFRLFVLHRGTLHEKFTETHRIRAYKIAEVRRLLQQARFDLAALYAPARNEAEPRPPPSDAFRVIAVAKAINR